MLAGLDAADLPIPLGGTSNHFRTSALIELGGWDPYNVTEDADLGIRASALGYRVGVVNSTTMEEANTSIPELHPAAQPLDQGLHADHARARASAAAADHADRAAPLPVSFALLIGGTPATFLGVLPLYVVTLFTIFIPAEVLGQFFPVWLLWLCLVNFIIGNSVMVYLSMMGPYKRGTFELILWAILNPIYWILHSIASYKGLWQLITKPHYWEKTEHGLTESVTHERADVADRDESRATRCARAQERLTFPRPPRGAGSLRLVLRRGLRDPADPRCRRAGHGEHAEPAIARPPGDDQLGTCRPELDRRDLPAAVHPARRRS